MLVRERALLARALILTEREGRGGPHGILMDVFADLEVSSSDWLVGDPERNGEGGSGVWTGEDLDRGGGGWFDGSGRIPRKEGVGRLAAERGWMDWTRV